MNNEKLRKTQLQTGKRLAALAQEAAGAFREDNPDAYEELLRAFEGKSADVGLLGHGGFHVEVRKKKLSVEANAFQGGSTAHGVTTPETLLDIADGRLTPLEAYFKGDLMVRAKSAELHQAYDYLVKFSESALRNKRLRDIVEEFRAEFGSGQPRPGSTTT
jgi:hypothetical protein